MKIKEATIHHHGEEHGQVHSVLSDARTKTKAAMGKLLRDAYCSGVTIGLHPTNGKTKGSGDASIGFMVTNIKKTKDHLKKNKVKFKEDDGKSGIYLHFKDPNGTLLYFSKPKWKY